MKRQVMTLQGFWSFHDFNILSTEQYHGLSPASTKHHMATSSFLPLPGGMGRGIRSKR